MTKSNTSSSSYSPVITEGYKMWDATPVEVRFRNFIDIVLTLFYQSFFSNRVKLLVQSSVKHFLVAMDLVPYQISTNSYRTIVLGELYESKGCKLNAYQLM